MMKRTFLFIAAWCLVASAGSVSATDRPQFAQVQAQDQEQIYGSQIMTPEERFEYRAKMRAATTNEERERIRREHHEQMKVRAKEQGMTLPDEPPERGMGRGMGPGGGMGDGGMGSGGMRGGRR